MGGARLKRRLYRTEEALRALSGRRQDLLCLLIVLGLPVLFFANVLFTGQVLVGDNLARFDPWRAYASEELLQQRSNWRTDPLVQYYPHRVIANDTIKAGDLPLWNPYYLSGTPFLATEPVAGLFYPPSIVYYLVSPLQGFGISACLHLALAGLFMYLYLRSIDLERISSLFGAVSFQFCGYFLVNLMWLSRVSTAVWTPFLFYCVEKYWRERKRVYALGLAFGVAMCTLAGTPPVVVFVMSALAIYTVFRLAFGVREGRAREDTRASAVILAAVVLGTLLAAVQLAPTIEATPFFERTQLSYEEAWDTGKSPWALATALVPDVFGNPVDADAMWAFRPWVEQRFGRGIPSNYARPQLYTSLAALVFGFWAVCFRRNRYVLFFAALAVVTLSLFLNIPDLMYRILYAIPLFRLGRLMEVKIVYAFSLCVLGAWGFSSLLHLNSSRSTFRARRASEILIAISLAGLTALALLLLARYESDDPAVRAWYAYNVPNFWRACLLLLAIGATLAVRIRQRMGAHVYGFLAVVLVVVDTFYFGWKFNPPQPAKELLGETGGIAFLNADGEFFRIMRGPGSDWILPPNTAALYGISDAQGFSSLTVSYYQDFMNLLEPGIAKRVRIEALENVESFSSRLLDLLNVKYILMGAGVTEELQEYDRVHEDVDLVYDAEIKIYQNRDVLPRAFIVQDFEVVSGVDDALARLSSEEFDPGASVILEQQPSAPPQSVDPRSSGSTARIVKYLPNRVVVETESSSDGFLVLTDLYYAGWQVQVDGAPQTLYKADYIFRAVQLLAGRHTVEFVFDPLSFKVGAAVSLCALALLAALWVSSVAKRRSSGV
jgi:hypothetical protein